MQTPSCFANGNQHASTEPYCVRRSFAVMARSKATKQPRGAAQFNVTQWGYTTDSMKLHMFQSNLSFRAPRSGEPGIHNHRPG